MLKFQSNLSLVSLLYDNWSGLSSRRDDKPEKCLGDGYTDRHLLT